MSKDILFTTDNDSEEILRLEPDGRVLFRDGAEIHYKGELRFTFESDTPGAMIELTNVDGSLKIETVTE